MAVAYVRILMLSSAILTVTCDTNKGLLRHHQISPEFQAFRHFVHEGIRNLMALKDRGRSVHRNSNGLRQYSEPLAPDYHRQMMQNATDLLRNLSDAIRVTNAAAVEDINRKAVRRIDERAIPAYYVDRIDRDYFTEYFSEIHDEAGTSEYDLIVEHLNKSLLTNVERVGLLSALAYTTASDFLETLADGENSMSLDFCDGQGGNCDLAAMLRTGDAKNFDSSEFSVNGVKFKLSDKLSAKAKRLQVFVTSSLRNPYTFDPSVKFTGPIVSIGLKDPDVGLFISEEQAVQILIPLNLSNFVDSSQPQTFQTVAKPLPDVKPEDIPALKMTLLPNTTLSIRIMTNLTLDLFVVITEKYRPVPGDFCRSEREVRKLKPAGACDPVCVYPSVQFTSRPGPEDQLSDYYIGVYPNLNDNASSGIQPGTNVSFGVSVYRLNCVFRDEDRHVWSEQGCQVQNITNSYLICNCPHLSTFTATQLVTPTFLELANIQNFGPSLRNNYVIGFAVGLLLLAYGLMVILCRRLDRIDDKAPGIHLMVDPAQGVQVYYYLITVYSGGLFKPLWMQPTCNISLQLYGCNGASLPYVLREESQKNEFQLLRNNGVDSYLVSSYKDLGDIERVRIWRDNHGKYPDWYCRKIIVHCLNSSKINHFFVNRALSVGYFGYATTHDVTAATPADISSWKRRYLENVYDLLADRHTWLSALQRRPGSLFTRCQRLTCAFSTIFVKLILTFAFLNVFTENNSIEVGEFKIQITQLLIALEIFVLVLPFELLVRFLFKASKPRKIPTLIIWTSDEKLGFNNYQIFGLTPDSADSRPELVPVYLPHQLRMQEAQDDKFSIPTTNMPEMEQWLSTGIEASEFISYKGNEPDYFVRSFEDGSGDHGRRSSVLASIEWSDKLEQIRRSTPGSLTFAEGQRPIEGLIEDEMRKNKLAEAQQQRTKKKRKEKDVNEEDRLATVMGQLGIKLPPVQVKHVRSQKAEGKCVHVSVGLHAPALGRFCRLPRCCIAFGWFVGLTLIFGCAVVAIFYGLPLGPIVTRMIFSNMVITVALSIFVTQPLVILAIAAIKTTVFKTKNIVEEERFQVLKAGEKPTEKVLTPYQFDTFRPQRFHPPLGQAESFNLKIANIRAHNTNRILLKLLLHAILMCLLLVVTYSNHSPYDYLAVRDVKELLKVDTDWADIQNASDFYLYLEDVLGRDIYPSQYYDGEPIPYFEEAPIFLADEASLLMGVPRLHQFRIHPKSTCAKSKNPYCASEAFIKYETRNFGPRWLPLARVSSSLFRKNNAWKYLENLDAATQVGLIRDYPRGGYIAYLGRNFFRSFAVLNYLQKTDWIDGSTRAIFLEVSFYNANVNLFLYTKLMAEISGTGSWLTSSITLPITLTNERSYADEVDNTVFHLVLLFGCTMAVLLLKICVIIYERRVYRSLYVSEIVLVCLVFGSIVIAWYRLNLVVEFKAKVDQQFVNDHVPLDEIAFWDQLQQDLFAISFSYTVLMVWEFLLAAKKEFYMLHLCLSLVKGLLVGQALILVLLLVSFSTMGYVLFGGVSFGFHSSWAAFISLLHEIVDEYILDEVKEAYPISGELFHLLFTFTAVLIGINLIIALLSQGFEDAKRIALNRTYWISYLNIVGKWCPLGHRAERPFPFVHPYRLRGMQEKTRQFLRGCLETPQVRRMQEINEFCKRRLEGTGYCLVSNSLKKRRIRANKRYQERLELMRLYSLHLFSHKLQTKLTAEEVKKYSEFSEKILHLKLKKLEGKVANLHDIVTRVEITEKKEWYKF